MPDLASFQPRLDILPEPQRQLWRELAQTPSAFTLYGGTAIALRLGHRQSVDFDFFSFEPFVPMELMASVGYLASAHPLQTEANTLTVSVHRDGPVKLSYFGGLKLGQVFLPEKAEDTGLAVASLTDLGGTKVAVVTQRAELKDYLDLHALLTLAKLPLAEMLAAAKALYGSQFNPLISLKAISYHDDEGLAGLPASMRRDLLTAAKSVKPAALPQFNPVRPRPD